MQVSYEFFTPRKLPILFLDLAQGKLDESFGVLLLGQPWMSWGGGGVRGFGFNGVWTSSSSKYGWISIDCMSRSSR